MKIMQSLTCRAVFIIIIVIQLLILTIPSSAIPFSPQASLPFSQEQELGRKFIKQVKQHFPIFKDPIVNDYIQHLGYELVAYSPTPDQHFDFFIVSNSSINAFAGPDGYVGIFAGTILQAQNESELASVLAHEIAHVSQHHIMRSIAKQKETQFANIASILAAIAIGIQNPQAGSGILSASTAGSYQQILNYSREFEQEADRIGMHILKNAGFNPKSMPKFLTHMSKTNELSTDDVPELLRTHPVTLSRIADTENRTMSSQKQARPYKENPDFPFIQSRIAINLSANPEQIAQQLQRQLKMPEYQHNPVLRYAYALALSKAGKLNDAEKQIDILIKQNPEQIIFELEKANILDRKEDSKKAIRLLTSLYHYNKHYYPLVMQYAETLIHDKDPQQAAILLKNHEEEFENDEGFLMLLFQAQGLSHQRFDAYQTRAKFYLLYDNKKAAIQQLRLALQLTRNAFQQQQIKIQLQRLESGE